MWPLPLFLASLRLPGRAQAVPQDESRIDSIGWGAHPYYEPADPLAFGDGNLRVIDNDPTRAGGRFARSFAALLASAPARRWP